MTRKRGESRSQEKALGKIRAGHSTGGCFPGYRSVPAGMGSATGYKSTAKFAWYYYHIGKV